MKNKKIVFVTLTLHGGGAERAVSILASELAIRGYNVSIICFIKEPQEYSIDSNVNITYIYSRNEIKKDFISATKIISKILFSINKKLRNEKYDIVIPLLSGPTILTFLANLFIKNKFVFSIKNHVNAKERTNTFTKKIIRYFELKIANFSDAIFLLNEEQKTYFSEINQKKAFVVPNPIDERMFVSNVREFKDIKKIVTAGRLVEVKNHKMLIDTFHILRDKYPHIILEIYGEGPLKNELQKQINKLQLEDKVFLCDRSETIEFVYKNADLFVFPSNSEGLPNALLEAMASGLPCISTNCPTGPSDAIDNMENGILIPVGSAIDMANAIELLVNDITLSNKLAKNANKTALERFEKNVVIDKFIFELENKLYKS